MIFLSKRKIKLNKKKEIQRRGTLDLTQILFEKLDIKLSLNNKSKNKYLHE